MKTITLQLKQKRRKKSRIEAKLLSQRSALVFETLPGYVKNTSSYGEESPFASLYRPKFDVASLLSIKN